MTEFAADRNALRLWYDRRGARGRAGLAALAGGLAALSQAPLNLWPFGLLGFGFIYLLWRDARSLRRAAFVGWAAGAGYFLVWLAWLVEPFLVDVARHGWMAPFALLGMAGGMAIYWGLGATVARALGGRAWHWIAAMTLAEMARAYLFTGFPWALIGYVLAPSPFAHWAAVTGPHGLSVLVLASGASLAGLVAPRAARRGGAVAVLGIVALLGAGGAWLGARPVPQAENAPLIRLVQPNAPQHQKWDPALMPLFFGRALEATRAAPRPDLVVWPETSLPNVLHWAESDLAVVTDAAGGVPVVLGAQRSQGGRWYNSLLLIDSDGALAEVYDKLHLVPFGEYVPFGDVMADFGITGLAAREGAGFSPGSRRALLDLPGIGPALPLICYEAVFPQDINAAPARPRLLLQITNDAWFGRLTGPYQHLAQARMRAIEQGVPMVRAANTGVSAMIDARGRILGQLPLGEAGHLDLRLPPRLAATPYSRTGDAPLGLGLVLALAAAALSRLARRKSD